MANISKSIPPISKDIDRTLETEQDVHEFDSKISVLMSSIDLSKPPRQLEFFELVLKVAGVIRSLAWYSRHSARASSFVHIVIKGIGMMNKWPQIGSANSILSKEPYRNYLTSGSELYGIAERIIMSNSQSSNEGRSPSVGEAPVGRSRREKDTKPKKDRHGKGHAKASRSPSPPPKPDTFGKEGQDLDFLLTN